MTIWNVIEQIHDPKSSLKLIIDLLKDDGEIFIKTPIQGSLAKKLSKEWSNISAIQHVNLFFKICHQKVIGEFGRKCNFKSSFGPNIFKAINPNVKKALDQMAKKKVFGAKRILRFKEK